MIKYIDELDSRKFYYITLINKETKQKERKRLPDSWFIMPNQTLYNTGNGHNGINKIHNFINIVDCAFRNSKNLDGMSMYYFELADKIKNKEFTDNQLQSFLNSSLNPVYIEDNYEFPFDMDKDTLNYIVGAIHATGYFYKYFENMQKFCLDPKKELDRLRHLTNNSISDIFVRWCGFHKVESKVSRNIKTSDLYYKENFKQYIDACWNINYISPIIIQRDSKQISQLNTDSLFVKKYII